MSFALNRPNSHGGARQHDVRLQLKFAIAIGLRAACRGDVAEQFCNTTRVRCYRLSQHDILELRCPSAVGHNVTQLLDGAQGLSKGNVSRDGIESQVLGVVCCTIHNFSECHRTICRAEHDIPGQRHGLCKAQRSASQRQADVTGKAIGTRAALAECACCSDVTGSRRGERTRIDNRNRTAGCNRRVHCQRAACE